MDENVSKDVSVPENEISKTPRVFGLMVLLLVVFLGAFLIYRYPEKIGKFVKLPEIGNGEIKNKPLSSLPLKKFSSFAEYSSYFDTSYQQITGVFSGESRTAVDGSNLTVTKEGLPVPAGQAAERYSETNIQVKGVDEPDIVKTDGKDIYVSGIDNIYYQRPGFSNLKTKIIGAAPVDEMVKKSEIDKSGDMFLQDSVLVIFSGNTIFAYDVSDPKLPKGLWKHEIDENIYLVDSRLRDGKMYLVLRLSNFGGSCEIPLTVGAEGLKTNCLDVYHPRFTIPADTIFTVLKIDYKSGKVENKNSFVGNTGQSIFYMSENGLYLTYTYYEDLVSLLYEFYSGEGKDLLPAEVLVKIKNLRGMDIGLQAKLTELSQILEKYKMSLSKDNLLKVETETQNKLSDYYREKIREFEHSGIVKISPNDLEIVSSGEVPGRPLNQFSLDEYQGNLRIATTVGGGTLSDYSVNDVYILNADLDEIGKVLDMGEGEKIYSARFINNRGYVVTFKQTDPFYVLDLSDPKNPKKTGEVKIPGYSSYLHPLEDNLILGVGKEGQKVKISLFNVSDPSGPSEIDKYSLDEYWSQIEGTHHAFLQDSKHRVFFIPGGKGGYIFSYDASSLKLVKAVSDTSIKRALYIDNYLYLVGDSKITVLDEKDWRVAGSVDYR